MSNLVKRQFSMNYNAASDVDSSRPCVAQSPSRFTNDQSVHAMQGHVAMPCCPEGPLTREQRAQSAAPAPL